MGNGTKCLANMLKKILVVTSPTSAAATAVSAAAIAVGVYIIHVLYSFISWTKKIDDTSVAVNSKVENSVMVDGL